MKPVDTKAAAAAVILALSRFSPLSRRNECLLIVPPRGQKYYYRMRDSFSQR